MTVRAGETARKKRDDIIERGHAIMKNGGHPQA